MAGGAAVPGRQYRCHHISSNEAELIFRFSANFIAGIGNVDTISRVRSTPGDAS
jgi:hypothetical protein